jgi:hypothetical protein
MERDESVKVNDRFEFPESIDLAEFVDDEGEKLKSQYTLHAVLVQGGNVHGGHYVAYIRLHEEWFCFDDDKVWMVVSMLASGQPVFSTCGVCVHDEALRASRHLTPVRTCSLCGSGAAMPFEYCD